MHPLQFQGTLPPYLPFIDPDHFHEPEFYRNLEKMGITSIMLGGTGGARMWECVQMLRKETRLKLFMHPSNPGEVAPVDLILLPAVMNSNSHYTRPFGSGAVTCAMAVAERKTPYLPVAYFVLGDSTARWYADAFLIHSKKLIVGCCLYAVMTGYEWIFLDYEDPELEIDFDLIKLIKARTKARIMVSDEFTPEEAREARRAGVDTITTPSNIYETHPDPLSLAQKFREALLP